MSDLIEFLGAFVVVFLLVVAAEALFEFIGGWFR